MAVSSPATMASVVTEFGGTAPHNLSEYVRGGTYVPNGPSQNANISTTTAGLQLSQFAGAIKATLVDQIPDSSGSGGGIFGSASVQFQTNGTAYDPENATSGKWYDPLTTSIGSSYWIRATTDTAPTGNGAVAGIVGAGWLQITATRTISFSITTTEFVYDSDSCVIKVEFAASSGGTVLLTAYVTLTAEAYGNV